MTRLNECSLLHDAVAALINESLPEEELIRKLQDLLDQAQPNAPANQHKFQNWASGAQPFAQLHSDFLKLKPAQVSKDLRYVIAGLNSSEKILSRLNSGIVSQAYVSTVNVGMKEVEKEIHECIEGINCLLKILNDFKLKVQNGSPDTSTSDVLNIVKKEVYFSEDQAILIGTTKIKWELKDDDDDDDDATEFSQNVVAKTVNIKEETMDEHLFSQSVVSPKINIKEETMYEQLCCDQTFTTDAVAVKEEFDNHSFTCRGGSDIDLDMSVTLEPDGEPVMYEDKTVNLQQSFPTLPQVFQHVMSPSAMMDGWQMKIKTDVVGNLNTNGMLPCPVCSKPFNTRDHLRRHIRTHSGRRYTCSVCDRTFNRKDSCDRHRRLHANDCMQSLQNPALN